MLPSKAIPCELQCSECEIGTDYSRDEGTEKERRLSLRRHRYIARRTVASGKNKLSGLLGRATNP